MKIVHEIFPGRLQERMEKALQITGDVQEIRIRVHAPIMIRSNGCEYFVTQNGQVTGEKKRDDEMMPRDLEDIVYHICRSSLYAYEEELRRGYLTIEGGYRIGITGQAVLDSSGCIKTIKNISFLNIRIAHEVPGVARKVLPHLYEKGEIKNTLVISPPGYGKTTLLRDMVRLISDGNEYGKGRQCCVIDERSEVAGCFRGVPQLDVGCRTDVLDSCPKSIGMMMVIRSMAPQIIAVDELGTMEDIKALFAVIRSGSGILATIHGDSVTDLRGKTFLDEVMKEKVFERYIVLRENRTFDIYNGELEKC